MKKRLFIILLILISGFGLYLRLINYDRVPPFLETKDEFFYPWAGVSFLQTGVPVAWANFSSYSETQTVSLWGESFRMVKPWIEKPPLYWLLSGTISLISGENEFYEVRLSTARLLPITLNVISILLIGFLTARIYGKKSAVMAALFYATVPTIVLGNRLNLTENLLIPISLATLLIYLAPFPEKFKSLKAVILGLGCAAALLTKNIGMALPLSIMLILFFRREWKSLFIIGVFSFIGGLIHPIMGFIYNWDLYTQVLKEYRVAHALGLPETIASIFLYPVIGHKEKIILDGSMFTGYIIFFGSLLYRKTKTQEQLILLAYPASYIAILALLEGGRTWFGWHLFPLYPFLMILLGVTVTRLIEDPDYLQFLIFYFMLGVSALRFLLLLYPAYETAWQIILGCGLLVASLPFLFQKTKLQKLTIGSFFVFVILVNFIADLNAASWYGQRAQPRQKPLEIRFTNEPPTGSLLNQ